MPYNPKFGPTAQTPEQRTRVLRQMQITFPHLKTGLNAQIQALYAKYVAGELSWSQMRSEMTMGLTSH